MFMTVNICNSEYGFCVFVCESIRSDKKCV